MEELKGSRFAHVTKAHPCFNEKMHDKVGRAHVPIAPKCNIYCNFCTRDINQDENRPGVASCVMDPDSAIEHVENVTKEGPISVVGVAGPGDSLANEATFEFFEKLGKNNPDLIKCMSTNGLLLPDYAERVAELGVNTVTVTVNAIDPEIAKDIYTFINYNGKIYKGKEAAEILIKNQLDGIEKLANLGVIIKVNSVLIPGLNDEHIVEIAKEVKKRGASLMNVLPLIPLNKMKDYPRPNCAQIEKVRDEVEEVLPVFRACTQCRADAYGIPGKKSEDKHLGMTPASHY
ncbi:FeMo cofactor biosynthesis protein NifB [bioreactor metagenome]|uniref:FeMo cofactor biosynthesis protein NifB n=1 Tax=bioreactor metagenome TaxID=1076179 RepID=A0A644U929_9ZZZZ|nr:radical SAM protein [Methanobrevibacter sp.]MEA4957635.1 radical SAM protein [Methanobrevibacter sp.]